MFEAEICADPDDCGGTHGKPPTSEDRLYGHGEQGEVQRGEAKVGVESRQKQRQVERCETMPELNGDGNQPGARQHRRGDDGERDRLGCDSAAEVCSGRLATEVDGDDPEDTGEVRVDDVQCDERRQPI